MDKVRNILMIIARVLFEQLERFGKRILCYIDAYWYILHSWRLHGVYTPSSAEQVFAPGWQLVRVGIEIQVSGGLSVRT